MTDFMKSSYQYELWLARSLARFQFSHLYWLQSFSEFCSDIDLFSPLHIEVTIKFCFPKIIHPNNPDFGFLIFSVMLYGVGVFSEDGYSHFWEWILAI